MTIFYKLGTIMKKEKTLCVVSIGFALFSMFFGSGNLVFPIAVGQESEGHFITASLGVLSTCVIFPLLGMLGMTLYKGNIEEFFGCFGKKGIFLFSLLCLSLMGPFGVLARCLTVIHGALLMIFPSARLEFTSFLMCLILYFLTVNKNKIVTILGTILTPFLLLSIGAIVVFGLRQGNLVEPINNFGLEAFKNGFFKGYQTMDLVASFFFSGFVIKHLYQASGSETDKKSRLMLFIKSSLVGAALLYVVYFSLVLLGWLYAPVLANSPPQEMFGRIAVEALGSMAGPCVGAAVIFACLTTSMALTSLFADFLRNEVSQEKISNKLALLITLAIAYFVSNLDFTGIASFLGPILETIYPALITLTIINISCKLCGYKTTHWPFTMAVVTKLCLV
jgi:LIVCS family branched-chain amino acid:cation transporter